MTERNPITKAALLVLSEPSPKTEVCGKKHLFCDVHTGSSHSQIPASLSAYKGMLGLWLESFEDLHVRYWGLLSPT